jgi:hypothetical protein
VEICGRPFQDSGEGLVLEREVGYIYPMAKAAAQTTVMVRDKTTGKTVVVRGVGSLKGSQLQLKKGIDLTKPIASQTLNEKRK